MELISYKLTYNTANRRLLDFLSSINYFEMCSIQIRMKTANKVAFRKKKENEAKGIQRKLSS